MINVVCTVNVYSFVVLQVLSTELTKAQFLSLTTELSFKLLTTRAMHDANNDNNDNKNGVLFHNENLVAMHQSEKTYFLSMLHMDENKKEEEEEEIGQQIQQNKERKKMKKEKGKPEEEYNLELRKAGVTKTQWERICALTCLRPNSSDTSDTGEVESQSNSSSSLPYTGIRNSLRNDVMCGPSSKERKEWVDLFRVIRTAPYALSYTHLPARYQSKLSHVQSTIVLSCLSPISIQHCLLPIFNVTTLFALTHVNRSVIQGGDSINNMTEGSSSDTTIAANTTTNATEQSEKTTGSNGVSSSSSLVDVEYYYGTMVLKEMLYYEHSNCRLPCNLERCVNRAPSLDRKMPTILIMEEEGKEAEGSSTSYVMLERLFLQMRRRHGSTGDSGMS